MEENINEICKDCMKWEKFNKDCFVHWDKKKHCTMKVMSEDELKKQSALLR